ncbi:DUF6124 family protein [Pseudomonas cannabina]|uniref:DUF6124 family protein n=1 Tax=Pseudomonas cannabina TaxID=86840 RepID=UPI00352D5654
MSGPLSCMLRVGHSRAHAPRGHAVLDALRPPLHVRFNRNIHISDILRCAAATAYETGDSLNGPKRDLAFSVVHLINMAKTELEHSLECVQNA